MAGRRLYLDLFATILSSSSIQLGLNYLVASLAWRGEGARHSIRSAEAKFGGGGTKGEGVTFKPLASVVR